MTVMASSGAVSDPTGARRLGNASIGTSIAGIIISVIIVIVVVAVVATSAPHYCSYTYLGTCWRYRSYVGTYAYCSGYRSSSGYCYHD